MDRVRDEGLAGRGDGGVAGLVRAATFPGAWRAGRTGECELVGGNEIKVTRYLSMSYREPSGDRETIDSRGLVMRDAGTAFRELGPESGERGGGGPPSHRPSLLLDDPLARDWTSVAAQVMAQERGVARRWSWPSTLIAAFRRGAKRLLALQVAPIGGALLGAVLALAATSSSTSWPARLWRLPLALLEGAIGGLVAGLRTALKGKVFDAALVATVVHRWRPIFTLPKRLTHHLFGLVFVTRYDDVKKVLGDGKVFAVDVYDERMRATTGAFFLGLPPGQPYQTEQEIGRQGIGGIEDLRRTRSCVEPLSQALVAAALQRPSHTLDVVSELLHPVLTANLECFFGLSDTKDQRVQTWIQTVSFYIFNFWMGGPYRTAAVQAGAALGGHLLEVVNKRAQAPRRVPIDAIDRMLAANKDPAVIARTLGGVVAGSIGPISVVFPDVVNQLLDLPPAHRRRLRAACLPADKSDKSDKTVEKYVVEAVRLAPAPPLIYRHAAAAYAFCGGKKNATVIESGAFVVTAPVMANLDATHFARPTLFDPDRDNGPGGRHEPLIFGSGQHACLGKHMGLLLLTEMVKALFARDVRRFPGPAGRPTKGPAGQMPEGDFTQRFIVEIW